MTCKGKTIVTINDYDILECATCGFIHVYPYPTKKEIADLYENNYYEETQPMYIKKLEEDSEWWKLVYSKRVKLIEKYIISSNTTNISTLDIGSGAGYYLLAAKEQGWKGKGIEPSKTAYQYSRELGLDVENVFFDEEVANRGASFDVVHLNHVLEHIPYPEKTLCWISNILTKNGLICIAVPNDFNDFQQVLWKNQGLKPWWISPLEHVNYFDFKSLENLLIKNGFEIVEKTTSFPMELFLLMGDNFVEEHEKGRLCHEKRKRFDMSLGDSLDEDLRENFYKALATMGIGRDVIYIARKIK